jgi:hypothetical protein
VLHRDIAGASPSRSPSIAAPSAIGTGAHDPATALKGSSVGW